MKYYCPVCKCEFCFDGSTDKSLPEDIKQHEKGEFHRRHIK